MHELRYAFMIIFLFTTLFLLTLKYTFEFIYSVNSIELIYVPVLALFVSMVDIAKRLIAETHNLVIKR